MPGPFNADYAPSTHDRFPISGTGVIRTNARGIVYVPKDSPGAVALMSGTFKADAYRTFSFELPPGELWVLKGASFSHLVFGPAHRFAWSLLPEDGAAVGLADVSYAGSAVNGGFIVTIPLAADAGRCFVVTSAHCAWNPVASVAGTLELFDSSITYAHWDIPVGAVGSAANAIMVNYDTPIKMKAGLDAKLQVTALGVGVLTWCYLRGYYVSA